MRDIISTFNRMMRGAKRNRNRRTILLVLACVVVFMTTYLLILPAFTLDADKAAEQGGIDIPEMSAEDASDEAEDDGIADEEEDDGIADEEEQTADINSDKGWSAESIKRSADTAEMADETMMDLRDLLKDVELLDDNENPIEGYWAILPGETYKLRFTFAETAKDDSRQFVNGDTPMKYTLPANVRLGSNSYNGTFNIDLGDQGTLENNTVTYDPETNSLIIRWNTEDPDFSTFTNMGSVEFHVDITAVFSSVSPEISFSDTVKARTQDYHMADIAKSGVYDETTGKINYTLKVTSVGESTNVVVQDDLQGALLKYAGDAEWASNKSRNDANPITPAATDDGGFSLTFPSMENGEVITITYSAEINYADEIAANWDIYNNPYSHQHSRVAKEDAVKNIATLTAEDNPDKEDECTFDNIYKESIEKNGTWEATSDENIKRIHWTAVINKEASVCYAGKTVTDRISDSVSDITKYDTTQPVRITVKDHSGRTVRTDNINWNDSRLTYSNEAGNRTWSYVIPEGDGNYQYTFEYDTLVDVTGLGYNPTIQNNIGVNGHSRYGSVQVPAGTASFGLTKAVNTVNGKNQVNGDYVEWKITIDVPAIGAVEAYLDDEFPRVSYQGSLLYDSLDTSDPSFGDGKGFVISGLEADEDYTYELIDKRYSWGTAKLVRFTFYQDKTHTTPGLKATESSRQITVTLRTANNQTWLDAYPDYGSTSQQAEHKNFAKLYTNGSTNSKDAEAKARPQHCRPIKTGSYYGTVIIDGVEYPIYQYQVNFQNIQEILDAQDAKDKVNREWSNGNSYARNWFEAEDVFDTSILRYLDANNAEDLEIMENAGIDTALADRLLRLGNTTGENVSWKPAIWDSSNQTFRFYDWEQIGRPNGTGIASNYIFNYYLIVKDADALAALQASTKNGSDYKEVELSNTIKYIWNNASSTAEVPYSYKPVSKNMTSYNESTRTAHYRIALNELRETMNNGDPMTMTDVYSNISVDYQTISVTTVPAARASEVSWNYSGNTGTYTIPDSTMVVIEYDATVLGTAGETVNFTNTATLEGKYSDGTNDSKVLASTGGGSGTNYRIRLSKYETDNQSKGLSGAVFQLYGAATDDAGKEMVGAPVVFTKGGTGSHAATYKNNEITYEHAAGDGVYFVTGSDGYVTVQMDQNTDGIALEKGVRYYLKEVKAPNGYKLSDIDWSFKIMDNADYSYGVWEYLNNDILTVPNDPVDEVEIRVVKIDENGDPLAGASFDLYSVSSDTSRTKMNEGPLVSTIAYGENDAVIYDNQVPLGSYSMIETAAPTGYYGLEDEVTINIMKTDAGVVTVTGSIGGVSIGSDKLYREEATGKWIIKLMNTRGYELPATGGSGTKLFYIFGSILLIASAALMISRKRSLR